MNKIKISKILPVALVLLSGWLVLQTPGHVFAGADPGCYIKSATSGAISRTTCPPSVSSSGADCYLSTASNSGQTPYTKVDGGCDTLIVGAPVRSGGPDSSTCNNVASDPNTDFQDLCLNTDTKGNIIQTNHFCGKGDGNEVHTSFNFGCKGDDPNFTDPYLNPIVDIAFALFRFLSAGVGLVVVGSIVLAGIQYTASRGDPQATGAAIKRISNSLIGLLIYVFLFAIANFLVPGGMFI